MTTTGSKSRAVRTQLIAMLPRLNRFAAMLAGDTAGRDEVVRRACEVLLEQPNRAYSETPFELIAFSEIHAAWLDVLRDAPDPVAQSRAQLEVFAPSGKVVANALDAIAFVAALPAQQRAALLLVYGEGFSYAEAARILDSDEELVTARLMRALSAYVEQIERGSRPGPAHGNVRELFPRTARDAS